MLRMVELFHEAGLPPGVVNLVNGRGASPARRSSATRASTWSASPAARHRPRDHGRGRPHLKPCILELGGKSANIIHPSARTSTGRSTAPWRASTATTASSASPAPGSSCTAASRTRSSRGSSSGPAGSASATPWTRRPRSVPWPCRAPGARAVLRRRRARRRGEAADRRRPRPGLRTRLLHGADRRARAGQRMPRLPGRDLRALRHLPRLRHAGRGHRHGQRLALRPGGYVWAGIWTSSCAPAARCGPARSGSTRRWCASCARPSAATSSPGVGRDGATTSSVEFFTELKTTTIPLDPPALPQLGRMPRDA
jgi:hypothetical protein